VPVVNDGARYAIGRRPALDVVRALAVLAVMLQHAFVPWAGNAGNVGVTLFFALSGFLITRLLLEEVRRDGRLNLRGFYLRRACRLAPALVLFLGFVAITAAQWHVTPKVFALTVLQLANVGQASGENFWVLGHMWSLSLEEQFYLVWPALLGLVALRYRRRRVVMGLLAVAVVCTLWRIWLQLDGAPLARVLFGPDVRVDALALGCALAFGIDRLAAVLAPARVRAVGMGGVAVLVACAPVSGELGAWTLAPVAVGSVAVVLWAASVTTVPSLGGVTRGLRWCGKVSYGAYLWHVPFAMLMWDVRSWPVRLAVTVAGAFAVAAVSWRVVERPFQRSRVKPAAEPAPAVVVAG
jgi:peptidoglycan/LPS O-acetylase OafA/YrhL